MTIDHMNGGGNRHRREINISGMSFYRWLKQNNYPAEFQVMCFNCNFAKHVLGECPHKIKGLDMFDNFRKSGKASFVIGGQFGSEGKGSAVASLALHQGNFDIVTTNNGSQSGHTSTHDGVTKVVFHLPTYSLYQPVLTYLNAGSIIDPIGLKRELDENPGIKPYLGIHPNAAVITPECIAAEQRATSAQTKIASTRKGVGEALSRKVLRSGTPFGEWAETFRMREFVQRLDLNDYMRRGLSVLVEVPQGHSLSLDGPFYPHTTSRNCTVMQAMSDAGIHPEFYHTSMMVIRTFPIRVGNVSIQAQNDQMGTPPGSLAAGPTWGWSGGHFPDQRETSWDELGVAAEVTTVTKRVRRVFTFSQQQVAEAIAQTRPSVIYLTFCDYHQDREKVRYLVSVLRTMAGPDVEIITQWGPTTADVIPAEELWA